MHQCETGDAKSGDMTTGGLLFRSPFSTSVIRSVAGGTLSSAGFVAGSGAVSIRSSREPKYTAGCKKSR